MTDWADTWTILVTRIEELREGADTPIQAGEMATMMGLDPTEELATVIDSGVIDSAVASCLSPEQLPRLIAVYGIAVGKLYAELSAMDGT